MFDGIRISSQGTVTFRELGSQPIHSQNVEKHLTFEDKGIKELKSLSSEDSQKLSKDFYVIYRADCCTYCAETPEEVMRVALTPQDYVCSPMVKRMTQSSHGGVFIKKEKKFKLLWKIGRFCDEGKHSSFLSPAILEKNLKKIFSEVEIELGLLFAKPINVIAWQIKTENGLFYVLWHNGLLTPAGENWEFTPKNFQELRQTYKVLRFGKNFEQKEYRITCG